MLQTEEKKDILGVVSHPKQFYIFNCVQNDCGYGVFDQMVIL